MVLTLTCCIVGVEEGVFVVKMPNHKTLDDLKKAIKQERRRDFRNVGDGAIELRKVRMPSVGQKCDNRLS